MADAPTLKPRPVSDQPAACKICAGPAPLFGVVDFNRCCEIQNAVKLPLCGIPVYYRRCQSCGFLYTDAFDDWSEADFKANIYNDGYLAVDPEYADKRPRAHADGVVELFGAGKTERRVLDYGGGNDILCSELRTAGFPVAVAYDPFVPEHAQRPQGQFDLITCFETLEHMPDPLAGIGALVASLADPGLVLFSTRLQPADFNQLGMNWWYVGPRNGHVSMFSREALVIAWRSFGMQTASFTDNLHIAYRTLPEFAKRRVN